jgi:transposase
MLTLSPHLRIYVHAGVTDMRKSFDGLSGLVRSAFQADPLDGSLFLFLNRRRDRVKILYWDRDGLALWCKRLEQGTFEAIPAADGSAAIQIDATQLAMWLGGVSLASAAQRRKRYRLTG